MNAYIWHHCCLLLVLLAIENYIFSHALLLTSKEWLMLSYCPRLWNIISGHLMQFWASFLFWGKNNIMLQPKFFSLPTPFGFLAFLDVLCHVEYFLDSGQFVLAAEKNSSHHISLQAVHSMVGKARHDTMLWSILVSSFHCHVITGRSTGVFARPCDASFPAKLWLGFRISNPETWVWFPAQATIFFVSYFLLFARKEERPKGAENGKLKCFQGYPLLHPQLGAEPAWRRWE